MNPYEGESENILQTCKRSSIQFIFHYSCLKLVLSWSLISIWYRKQQVKLRSSKLVWLFQFSFIFIFCVCTRVFIFCLCVLCNLYMFVYVLCLCISCLNCLMIQSISLKFISFIHCIHMHLSYIHNHHYFRALKIIFAFTLKHICIKILLSICIIKGSIIFTFKHDIKSIFPS